MLINLISFDLASIDSEGLRDELGEDHSADFDRCNRRSNDDGLPSLHKVITMTRPRVAELETDVGKWNNLSQSLQFG